MAVSPYEGHIRLYLLLLGRGPEGGFGSFQKLIPIRTRWLFPKIKGPVLGCPHKSSAFLRSTFGPLILGD